MLQLEVAGTVIQLEDNEAALVVYLVNEWLNQEILLSLYEGKFTDKGDIKVGIDEQGYRPYEKATVVYRRVSSDTAFLDVKHTAIFPRIRLDGKVKVNARVQGDIEKYHLDQAVVLHAGNVTEIVWTKR